MNSTSIKSRISQISAVAAVIVIGAVVILIATSGPPSTGSTADTSSSGSSKGGDTIDIANFKYDPPDLTVSAGSKVTFVNDDTAEHTATSDTEGAFDTDDLGKGDSKAVTLDKPGTYTYYCRFHSFMHGTITVK